MRSWGRVVVLGTLLACLTSPASVSAGLVKLDEGFGRSGVVAVPGVAFDPPAVPGFTVVPMAQPGLLAVDQRDRTIVAIPSRGFTVERITANGAADDSFGAAGLASLLRPDQAQATAVTTDAQNRVLVAGRRRSDGAIVVARLLDNGQPDPSFGSDGVTTAPDAFAFGSDVVRRVLALADGTVSALTESASVVRWHSDGTPDSSFGQDGRVTLNDRWQGQLNAIDMTAPASGDLLVGEEGADPEGGDVFFAQVRRLRDDGSIDSGYAGHFGSPFARIRQLVSQPDGRLLIAGGVSPGPNLGADSDPAYEVGTYGVAARLTASGTPDRSFGQLPDVPPCCADYSPATTDLTDSDVSASAAALDGSGRPVLAFEQTGEGILAITGLLRLTPGGHQDPAFGTCGIARIPRSVGLYSVLAEARQRNGRVVVLGSARGGLRLLGTRGAPRDRINGRPSLASLVNPFFVASYTQLFYTGTALLRGRVRWPIRTAQRAAVTITMRFARPHRGLPRLLGRTVQQIQPCRLSQVAVHATRNAAVALRRRRVHGEFRVLVQAQFHNRAGRSRVYTADNNLLDL